MNCVCFDPLRGLGIPGVTLVKPEHLHDHLAVVEAADWVLFPAYWQVNAIYYGLNPRIFPSAASYHLGHDKIEMTRAFQVVVPDAVPETLIRANLREQRDLIWDQMVRPFVAKNPRSARGLGVFCIDHHADWEAYCNQTESLYVQEYLPIDRDLRLVVVGQQVVAGYWRGQGPDGFHNNISQGGQVTAAEIPENAIRLVERICTRLHINYGGFDIAVVGGHCYVLEFNRLFGNRALESMESSLSRLIYEYLLQQMDFETQRPNPRPNPRPQRRAA